MSGKGKKVAVLGSGLIGKSWSMLWVSGGYSVSIYDIQPDILQAAVTDIATQLKELEKSGNLRGKLSAEEQLKLISTTTSLKDCVEGAMVVQENVPEKLELKKSTFAAVDALVGEDTILLSSTSAIVPSLFTADLKHRAQCMVAHPLNPPYYVPAVEMVPAPWTDLALMDKATDLLRELGQSPVVIKKEIPGFVAPRVQNAMIMECIRLVLDDMMSAEDVDKAMTHGLGMRYAFIGPLMTAHLNAEGMEAYCETYGEMIHDIASDSGPPVPLDPNSPDVQRVYRELCAQTPMDKLEERRAELRTSLARLAKLKHDMDAQE